MKKIALLFLVSLIALTSGLAQEKNKQEKKELKPALLVIDVQEQYWPMMAEEDQKSSLDYINWSIWIFRKFDLPVIRIYHTSDEYGPAVDGEGFEFNPDIKVTDDDYKVVKTYGNAFTKTDLDKILKELDVNTVYLCGLSAVGCVLSTYIGAADYDYQAFFIKDALLSHNATFTNQIEEMFGAVDVNTVLFMMEYTQE